MSCCSHHLQAGSTTNSAVALLESMPVDQCFVDSDGDKPREVVGMCIIHDLVTEGNNFDIRFFACEKVGAMKMPDDLEDAISRHHPPIQSILEFAPSDSVEPNLGNGAENNGNRESSWAMRRWKSQALRTFPWHCAELLSPSGKGVTPNEKRAGTGENGLNEGDRTIQVEEEAWSTKASAGSIVKDVENKVYRVIVQ